MQKIGQGLIERDLYKLKSDSSKILRMSILTDIYFLFRVRRPITDRAFVKFVKPYCVKKTGPPLPDTSLLFLAI